MKDKSVSFVDGTLASFHDVYLSCRLLVLQKYVLYSATDGRITWERGFRRKNKEDNTECQLHVPKNHEGYVASNIAQV